MLIFAAVISFASGDFFGLAENTEFVDCNFSTIRRRRRRSAIDNFNIQFWHAELNDNLITFNEVLETSVNATENDKQEYIEEFPEDLDELSVSSRLHKPIGEHYVCCLKGFAHTINGTFSNWTMLEEYLDGTQCELKTIENAGLINLIIYASVAVSAAVTLCILIVMCYKCRQKKKFDHMARHPTPGNTMIVRSGSFVPGKHVTA